MIYIWLPLILYGGGIHPYESADTEGNSKESNRLAGEVNITTDILNNSRVFKSQYKRLQP